MALPPVNSVIRGDGSGDADYQTIEAWETVLDEGDQMGEDYSARLDGLSGDNSQVYFGNTLNPNGNKIIMTPYDASNWATGLNSGSCAAIDMQMTFDEDTNVTYFIVEGIEFLNADDGIKNGSDNDGGTLVVTRCVFRDIGRYGISVENCDDITTLIAVCLFIEVGDAAWEYSIKANDSAVTSFITYSCTCYHSAPVDNCRGIYQGASTWSDLRNMAVCYYDNNVDADDYSGSPSNMSNCFSSGDGTGNVDTLRDDDTDWTNVAGDDFSILETGVLYHAGSVPGGGFPAWALKDGDYLDLVGTEFHATTPSVGCFEFPEEEEVAWSPVPNIIHHRKQLGIS